VPTATSIATRERRPLMGWHGAATGVGLAALGAMLAAGVLLAAAATTGASVLVVTGRPGLPDWIAGILPELGRTAGPGGLLAALGVLTAGYAVVLLCRRAVPAAAVIGAIVALHVVFALAPPLLSADVFSYVAYGRLGAVHHVSPYLHGPAVARHDPVLPYVSALWAATPSAYGPLFTLGSYGLALLGIDSALWGFKAVAALSGLAVVALVWRCAQRRGRDPVAAAAVVGLNPLLLVYAVGGGHNDLLMLALTLVGVLFALMGDEAAGAAGVIAGAAVKASSGVVLPFLLLGARRPARALAGAAAAAVAVAVLGLAAFGTSAFGWVGVLSQAHLVTSSSPSSDVVTLFGGIPHARSLGAVALGAVVGGLLWRAWRGMDWVTAAGWALLVVSMSTSAVFGWYTIWPLPFAALSPDRRLLAATLGLQALFIAHLLPDVVA
jgi:hypothetical protein